MKNESTLGALLKAKIESGETRKSILTRKPKLSIALEKLEHDQIRYAVLDMHESLRCTYTDDWHLSYKYGAVTICSDIRPSVKRFGTNIVVSLRGCDRSKDAQIHEQRFSDTGVRDATYDAILRALSAFAEGGYFHTVSRPLLVINRSWAPESLHSYY